jgi:TldD protein
MLENYTLGNKIAGDNVSIFDSGKETQYEYLPYDDEGTKAKKTYMIKDGYLNSRLHKVATAVELNEDLTSNARAIDYTYEPMVRMTTTCFDTGTCKKEDLFADVEKGIFVDTILGGAGMSVFNFSPNRSYLIENGKITKPVTVSLITGVVDEALNDIEKLSLNSNTEVKLTLFCGKPDQFGLRVGIGGPYIRVKKLNVR